MSRADDVRLVLLSRRRGAPHRVVADLVGGAGNGSAGASRVSEEVVLAEAVLPRFVATQEAASSPRWVWDDTTRWYPALLAAGVRVRRCTDLRLVRRVLRSSPWVDQALLDGSPGGQLDGPATDVAGWDALQPLSAPGPEAAPVPEGLFELDDDTAGLDVVAEHERQEAALGTARDPGRLRLLAAAESSAALTAAEMTFAGLPWSADVHGRILRAELGPRPLAGEQPRVLGELLGRLRDAFDAPTLNPDSPSDLLRVLRRAGLEVADTRSWTLQQLDHPAVPLLLEHRRLARLHAANGWRWLEAWVRDGRYRPGYSPGGVVTGRWASQGGGVLSVPAALRSAVVADPGWVLVDADVAQLEPRVLAAVSGDLALARAAGGRRGGDLYQGVVDAGALPRGSGRSEAKVAVLGAMYGATAGAGGLMVEHLAARYPQAVGHLEAAAKAGERGEPVHTWLGRGSPRPRADWADLAPDQPRTDAQDRDRRSWGRFTRNFVVQGSAAEWALAWTALLREELWRLGELGGTAGGVADRPHLVCFLHDEVLVHAPAALADEVADVVRRTADEATRLLFGDVPLTLPLDVTVGPSWSKGTAPRAHQTGDVEPPSHDRPLVDAVRKTARAALTTAMRARDRTGVAALRSLLAALDNAEAVPVGATGSTADHALDGTAGGEHVAGAVGVGAAEVARRELGAEEVLAVVRAEVAERETAAVQVRATAPDRAELLEAEAAVLRPYLAVADGESGSDVPEASGEEGYAGVLSGNQ